MRVRRIVRNVFVALALWLAAAPAGAHTLGHSYLYLQIYADAIKGRFEVAPSDLNRALGLTGTPREITRDTLAGQIEFVRDYYRQRVVITDGQRALPIRFTTAELSEAREGYLQLSFDLELPAQRPDLLTFNYSVLFEEDPSHRGFLLVEYDWATGTFANENHITGIFTPDARTQQFSVTSSGRLTGFLSVVRLGADHIWMGFDHVMFLIALLLPSVVRREPGGWQGVERFGPALLHVVKIVTAFTVAHSLTLSLAALGLVRLPERLVEVVIAVSIAIAAADILFPVFRGRVWLVVFGFGLFHGFGFAGALSEMGILGEHLWLALFGFNLGVELGQIVIVALILPALYALRQLWLYRAVAMPVAAAGMILIACIWAVERAFDVNVPMSELVRPMMQRVLS
jgi:hypothetical protein